MSRCVRALAAALLLGPWSGPADGAPPPFEELLANLKSPNAKTRQAAAQALGQSRRREAVTPLAAMVRDPEPKVRLEVARALRELRDPDALPAIVTSLEDGDVRVRLEAIAALVELYVEPERRTPVGRFLAFFSDDQPGTMVSPYVKVDASVHRGLAVALRDEERDVRREAAVALGTLAGRPVVADVVAALDDPDASVRGASVTALARMGTADEGKLLIPLLADESTDVRDRVMNALATLRVREAGPALRQMYEASRQKEMSLRLLTCLSRLGDPNQADLFRVLVQDPDPERRRLAVEGLGRTAGPELLSAFKKDFQRERNEELKLAYAFALTRLGDRAFVDTVVLSLPSRTLGRRCEGYLIEIGREVMSDLYPYLSDPDPSIRAALCDILAEMGDPDAVAHLTPLVGDPNAEVADRANRAVEHLRRLEQAPAGK